jgi:hypothetical protein
MKVLPFYLKQKQTQVSITNLTLFLANGGKALWQTEETTVTEKQLKEEYLEPNGFVWKQIVQTPDVFYGEIDSQKTPLQDFYTWEDAQKSKDRVECWRSFYFFKDATGSDWFSGKQLSESEIDGKSMHEYYESILRHFTN